VAWPDSESASGGWRDYGKKISPGPKRRFYVKVIWGRFIGTQGGKTPVTIAGLSPCEGGPFSLGFPGVETPG
jgi:hypothetical protein